VHLQADLDATIAWAKRAGVRWAFSLTNAGAAYAPFRNRLSQLEEIDWAAVGETDFRNPLVKEGKQAEFLVRGLVPWNLIERIGVRSERIRAQALAALDGVAHQPRVDVVSDWYF
jgi:hypothetical protein